MMTFSGIVLPSLGGDQVNYHDKALILACYGSVAL